jgi:hypothetical protein
LMKVIDDAYAPTPPITEVAILSSLRLFTAPFPREESRDTTCRALSLATAGAPIAQRETRRSGASFHCNCGLDLVDESRGTGFCSGAEDGQCTCE